jgi:hypothetical protein
MNQHRLLTDRGVGFGGYWPSYCAFLPPFTGVGTIFSCVLYTGKSLKNKRIHYCNPFHAIIGTIIA